MEVRTKVLLLLTLAILGAVIYRVEVKNEKLRSENERLSSNVKVLQERPIVRDSGRTMEVKHLSMSVDELRESMPKLKEELKAIGVDLKKLHSLQQASMQVNAEVLANTTDTIIKQQAYVRQRFEDEFLKFSSLQKVGDSTAKVKVNIPIDIKNAGTLYREGWPFGWGWFKPYKLKQTLSTTNPYVTLTYQEVIDVKRD